LARVHPLSVHYQVCHSPSSPYKNFSSYDHSDLGCIHSSTTGPRSTPVFEVGLGNSSDGPLECLDCPSVHLVVEELLIDGMDRMMGGLMKLVFTLLLLFLSVLAACTNEPMTYAGPGGPGGPATKIFSLF